MNRATASLLAAGLFATLCFTAACGKDPEVAKREFLKSGDDYLAQNKVAEAILQYRNAVQQDARFGEARKKLAYAYMAAGDIPNAYRESVRAADLLPLHFDASFLPK